MVRLIADLPASCPALGSVVASSAIVDYKAQAPGQALFLGRLRRAESFLMSKLKTKRAAAKRFRFTGTGKPVRNHAHHRHYLSVKSQQQKVATRGTTLVADADVRMVRRMLPYGS
jgi:large subunit ribosomal protein L35